MKSCKITYLIIILFISGGCSSSGNNQSDDYSNSARKDVNSELADTKPVVLGGKVNKPSNENSDVNITANENDFREEENPPEDNDLIDKLDEPTVKNVKYNQLNEKEKIAFIQKRMNHIAFLIANEKYYFNTAEDKKAIQTIKYWIDELQKRVGNGAGSRLWGGDLNLVFNRGKNYAPIILQAAKKRNVPKIVPLYIAAIETEYTNVSSQNYAGAAGLFQFIPSTARLYGIDPSERTNVPKMADIASKYIGDRMKEFGNDTRSVALCIAGYNRNPANVKRDLYAVLEMRNNAEKERSFWTMIENEEGLISRFGERERKYYKENMPYVPRFFAFAIIGETPWAFGVNLEQALSTYESATS